MGFLERLMCKHDYICVRNFVADDGYLSSAWRCKHCSKEMSKRGQHELHASVRTAQKSSSSSHCSNNDFMNPLNPISPNYIGNYSTQSSEHRANDCQPSRSGHSHDYGGSSYSSSDNCSSSSDSGSSSSSGD